jgi:hypothetical protein
MVHDRQLKFPYQQRFRTAMAVPAYLLCISFIVNVRISIKKKTCQPEQFVTVVTYHTIT